MNNDEYRMKLEDKMYEYRKKMIKEHRLTGLFLEMTLKCNAHCEHCGSRCGDVFNKSELSTQEFKDVLKSIADAPGYCANKIMLNVTGGEPLVRKDLFEIIEYADQLGFPWGITTNGILVDEEVVKNMERCHMYSISISLDGLKETHESFRQVPGSFDKIMHGLDLLVKSKIPFVQVTTCVSPKNIDELEGIYQLLQEHKINKWRIVSVDPIGRAKDNQDILLDKNGLLRMYKFIEHIKLTNPDMDMRYGCIHFLGTALEPIIHDDIPFICDTGINTASILANGDIFVCTNVERRPELIQGNVRKDNFIDVWEHRYKPFRKLTRTQNNKCKNCIDRKLCFGDAFHTWNFTDNEPNFCIHKIFQEEYALDKKIHKNDK